MDLLKSKGLVITLIVVLLLSLYGFLFFYGGDGLRITLISSIVFLLVGWMIWKTNFLWVKKWLKPILLWLNYLLFKTRTIEEQIKIKQKEAEAKKNDIKIPEGTGDSTAGAGSTADNSNTTRPEQQRDLQDGEAEKDRRTEPVVKGRKRYFS